MGARPAKLKTLALPLIETATGMSDEMEFAKAYQAIGKYFCAFSVLERELGEAVKVVLGLQLHQAADYVVAALNDVARKASLVQAAVGVAKNVNGSETSEEWKRSADKTMKGIFSCNGDRVLLAHGYLEVQRDGSVTLTKQNLSSGQLAGGPKTWNLGEVENKIQQVRDLTQELQRISGELSTLTIRIPDLPDIDLPDISWLTGLSVPVARSDRK
jgi:hypothetical protein